MASRRPIVFIVDDDQAVSDSLRLLLQKSRYPVESFASAEAFLDGYDPAQPGCLVTDLRMPGMSGLELQQALFARGVTLPVIFITGHGDIPASVQAIKAGAVDFLEKPFQKGALLARIDEALALDAAARAQAAELDELRARFGRLTSREREVMLLVVAGSSTTSNRQIAARLGISRRTVDNYRAWLMEKMQARSLPELVEMAKRLGVYRP